MTLKFNICLCNPVKVINKYGTIYPSIQASSNWLLSPSRTWQYQVTFDEMILAFNTSPFALSCIYIVLSYWNNIWQIDMSICCDTSRFPAKRGSSIFNCIVFGLSRLWLNPQPKAFEESTQSITPSRHTLGRNTYVVKKWK